MRSSLCRQIRICYPLQALTCCTYSQPITKAWLTTPAHVLVLLSSLLGFNHGMAISIYYKSTQLSYIRPGTGVICIHAMSFASRSVHNPYSHMIKLLQKIRQNKDK